MYGFIPLVDAETGEEYEFEVLEVLHHEDHVYYVLLNTEIPTDEVVIQEVVVDEDDEDEEEKFFPVEDKVLLDALFNMYLEKVKNARNKFGFIPLVDVETGEECEFEVLEILHYEDHVYYVLLNTEIPTDEVVILEVVVDEDDEDEEENFLPVEDEALLETLFNMYQEKQKK